MGISLAKMLGDAYADFRSISFDHHVSELIREEGITKETAETETERELGEMLPQGPETPGSHLMSVKHCGCPVGYLWFSTRVNKGVKQAFQCDFFHI